MNPSIKKVIAAVIIKDGKYLIAQRAKKDANYEKWEFPGGKVEAGETDQQCLTRELLEELGIVATVGDYLCSSYFEHNGNRYEMRAYFVQSFCGEVRLFDHKQVRWVSPSELSLYDFPQPDLPVIQALLSDVANNESSINL